MDWIFSFQSSGRVFGSWPYIHWMFTMFINSIFTALFGLGALTAFGRKLSCCVLLLFPFSTTTAFWSWPRLADRCYASTIQQNVEVRKRKCSSGCCALLTGTTPSDSPIVDKQHPPVPMMECNEIHGLICSFCIASKIGSSGCRISILVGILRRMTDAKVFGLSLINCW